MAGHEAGRWTIPGGVAHPLHDVDPGSTAGAPGGKDETRRASEALKARLADLQERLWAEDRRALLLVLQAMDAGGKDGAVKKVLSGVNPQGCRVSSFKQPSQEELAHDFLWRIHKALPRRGEIGVFNRSHYEDVVVVRVRKIVPPDEWRQRYDIINDFERSVSAAGTRIVKAFLHISKDEQARRLRKRLENPSKRWKFRREDLDDRALWDDYQTAYDDAISKTTTLHAPWHVVPADHKWYRDWALLRIVVDALEDMAPRFPEATEDLDGVVVE